MNKINFDYHIQTIDHGYNKPVLIEETVNAAIAKGLGIICLTDHYPLPSDFEDPIPEKDCAMKMELYPKYIAKVRKVKKRWKDKIEICFGAEFDWLPGYGKWTKDQLRRNKFDYVIGSVHFLGKYVENGQDNSFLLDYKKEEFTKGMKKLGGIINLCSQYYLEVQNMIRSKMFDAVGHMDLVKKYNDGNLFSEREDWYLNLVLKTLNILSNNRGMVLEINTSGFEKNCKEQYPSLWVLKEAKKRNIKITVGTDAHIPRNVGKNLDKAIQVAKLAGYDSLIRFKKRKMIEVKI